MEPPYLLRVLSLAGLCPTPAQHHNHGGKQHNFQKAASFGTVASATSFQAPRTYYFNFGVRF